VLISQPNAANNNLKCQSKNQKGINLSQCHILKVKGSIQYQDQLTVQQLNRNMFMEAMEIPPVKIIPDMLWKLLEISEIQRSLDCKALSTT
jgi:hypothetical protein